ncbi:polysaccharide biosynthesis tyrosine autokinase [Frankia sp. Mgl5]|uniref:polysaccharide biosynthesis tyrosine autokinase n=1 Tax=Frankia sp. Mgl5 TaxID=2933793 RepID=UPI00200DB1AA|nr:polysaccharide biosynthesis tyrosine autokinase [Frankia sp. Mgl5]MCK9930944.1 polysaccharide biosynthesis tyrosine autokinase [Frankia sp. Mgl5]
MELRDYVRVLRRSWLLVLTCVLLGGLLAATANWRAARIYAATVTMVVSSSDDSEGAATAYQGGLLSQQRVKSYANLVASERVAAAVIERLKLDDSPSDLRGHIQAQTVPDTVLLRAVVRDADPARARSIADAVGETFSEAVARIERPAADEPPSVRVSVWEHAKLPTTPVSPQPVRNIALGVLLGLLISIGAAFLRHRLDTSVTGEADANSVTGLPNLAMINYDSSSGRRPLIIHADPHSPRAESFRQLRTNLQFVDVDTAPRSILVSSSVPGEGKTTTVCNIAITLAQGGARVCLVEGDLRRPSFGEYLGIESAAGLTSVLIGAADLDDVLQPWGEGRVGDGRVEVLPSGPIPPNPSELLGSRNMSDLIEVLHSRFDIVLIDAPPLLPVTDAAVLATRVDGALLVARVGRTRREQLRRAAEALRAVDARIIGTVLNMVPAKGYYYGRYESYAPRARHARAPGLNWARTPAAPDRGLRPAGGRSAATARPASAAVSASSPVTSSPGRPAWQRSVSRPGNASPTGSAAQGASASAAPVKPATGARKAAAEVGRTGSRAGARLGSSSAARSAARAAAAPPASRAAAPHGSESTPVTGPDPAGPVPAGTVSAGGGPGVSAPGSAAAPAAKRSATARQGTRQQQGATAPDSGSPGPSGSAQQASDQATEAGANPPVVEIAAQREPGDHTAPLAYGAGTSDRGSDGSTGR